VPDLAALLREHVMPALVERGVVSREERAVVAEPSNAAPAPRNDPPDPGTVTVRATPPAASEPAEERPAQPSEQAVHLHIDRVVVTRAPAPAPPPAPAPRPPRRTVDHAAYLARRRERP
jgi:hypothetical protein